MHDDMIRRRVRAHGHVQGVFFRESAREQAESHEVSGWIANRLDGSVEAVLEGPREAVEQVMRFLESGPSGASVENLEVTDEEPEGLSGFDVR